ncbi:MAG: FMN-binding protein [Spirochaetales bacterium]|nr:FMN-binding protein [Spirochaetales bacterium]
MRDGYYTAEAASFDAYGWKEFITICVWNGRIVTVEYNAKNSSGFIKSWDMNYMRTMNAVSGTYPNEYTRLYAGDFLAKQDAESLDAVTGATESGETFKRLASAVLRSAVEGNAAVVLVNMGESSF